MNIEKIEKNNIVKDIFDVDDKLGSLHDSFDIGGTGDKSAINVVETALASGVNNYMQYKAVDTALAGAEAVTDFAKGQ